MPNRSSMPGCGTSLIDSQISFGIEIWNFPERVSTRIFLHLAHRLSKCKKYDKSGPVAR